MMRLKNIKIKHKMYIIIVISVVSLLILGFWSVATMQYMNKETNYITDEWVPSLIYSDEINEKVGYYRMAEIMHVTTSRDEEEEKAEKMLAEYREGIDENLEKYGFYLNADVDPDVDPVDVANFEDMTENYNEYMALSDQILELSNSGKKADAYELLMGDSMAKFEIVSELGDVISQYNIDGTLESGDIIKSSFVGAVIFIAAIVAVISILMFLITMNISKTITRPVSEINRVAKKIAKEDLNNVITYESEDELGVLSHNFNKTVMRLRHYIDYINEISHILDSIADGKLDFEIKQEYTGEFHKIKVSMDKISFTLNDILSKISDSSESITLSAGYMTDSANVLASGATQQTESVEELVAIANDITEKIENNAEAADKATRLVDQTRHDIVNSNDQMKNMIQAMDDMNEKSNQIVNIINTIEEIASQTNLLALNAAIEAARAGEAGRGFAVVADQVKVLATQSAEAAQDTVALINDTVKAVENGTNIANVTAKNLVTVVESIEDVSDTMCKISRASKEQTEYIADLKQGIEDIATVVHNNSASAEETASTSEEMNNQAGILKEMFSYFTIK